MKKQNKSVAILKDKTGASLLLVLCVMLLLMAIGTSVLAAASTNAGTSANESTYNQLVIYGDSIQKNIMFALQELKKSEETGYEDTLAAELIYAIYAAKDPDDTFPPDLPDTMTISFTNLPTDVNLQEAEDTEIALTFSGNYPGDEFLLIAPEVPSFLGQDEVVDGTTGEVTQPYLPPVVWEPKTATVNVDMEVQTKISVEDKTILSVSVYRIEDAVLTQTAEGSQKMIITEAGKWRLISHEKLDATV